MTGKNYYLTTLAAWQREAPRFANSHFLVLDTPPQAPSTDGAQTADAARGLVTTLDPAAVRILVLIEADEGVHLSLEDHGEFEALPHPLSQKPISDAAQSALAPHGVTPGATTFATTEILAKTHPLLRHRVF